MLLGYEKCATRANWSEYLCRDSTAYEIITNPHLIAVNQDPLGIQGECLKASSLKGLYCEIEAS